MTTIHMQTESVHTTARQMGQGAAQAEAELHALQRLLQELGFAWQGGSSDEFCDQAGEVLRQLLARSGALAELAGRLEREVNEWEQVDQRGAAALGEAGWLAPFYQSAFTPKAGGGFNEVPFYNLHILPFFTALSAVPLLSGLPRWLDSFLDRFFPEPEVNSPTPGDSAPAAKPPTTTFGDLLNAPSPASGSAQPTEGPAYETYYKMAPKSQGDLYGNAACSPTSVSMVTDYYHAQDSANQTVSPSEMIGMMDRGDGTPGSGMSLSNLTDELNDLGYHEIRQQVNASMGDLESELNNGPVIVTTGVRLIGGESRDIQQAGSTIHAMVVKGLNAESVVVNDPWSGSEKVFSREAFGRMWSNGSNGMYAIRP